MPCWSSAVDMYLLINDTTFQGIIDGFQTILLIEACRLMNLTPTFRPIAFTQEYLADGTPMPKILLDLLEQKADVAASGLFMRPIYTGILDSTYPWESICVR